MNRNSMLTAAAFTAALLLNINALAQKKGEVQENPPAPSGIVADGDLSEWDTGSFIAGPDNKLSYQVSNDNRILYLALKTSDRERVSKIIARGITFTVNPDGKKKEGPALTFPAGRLSAPGGKTTTDQAQQLRDRLSSAKEIRISGLKTIRDGGVSTVNEYGISAGASIDSALIYTYELAVPLDQLGLSAASPSPMAISIRINGINPPKIQAGPRSPYESMRRGGYGRVSFPEALKPEEFWIKRTLATKNN